MVDFEIDVYVLHEHVLCCMIYRNTPINSHACLSKHSPCSAYKKLSLKIKYLFVNQQIMGLYVTDFCRFPLV